MATERLFIGVMSGTSCDGADAALVRVTGHGVAMRGECLHLTSLPYADVLRDRLRNARNTPLLIGDLAGIGHAVAGVYSDCVRRLLTESGRGPETITAVAAHGQTLFHAPPVTYQAFDPALLARRIGIDVVSDFRRADCAAGGQGAPLVPFGDWVLFRSDRPRVLLNLGGIANVTVLPADAALEDVLGYDVGPANCWSDWLMKPHGGVDENGDRAARGEVIRPVVNAVLRDDFFRRPPPKSTDTPAMISILDYELHGVPGSLEDKLATANESVAEAVGLELDRLGLARDTELFVAGGGVRNGDLMRRLQSRCGPMRLTDDLGVPAQAREAVAFALLAAAHVDRLPVHMPKVTGATRPAILGSLTPAGIVKND